MTSLRRYGQTVGQLLNVGPLGYDEERVSLLRSAVKVRLENPRDADPIRCFIKHEPHKLSKLEENRLRLISAVSLVDTMTDRIMFGWLARTVLMKVGETPVMVGWSPTGGGLSWMIDLFRGKTTRGLDMTAWDWTVMEWMILALRDLVKSLALFAPAWWYEWVDARWEMLFRDAIFCFADGTLVRQPGWGVIKSGCFLTIILNSFGQILKFHLASRRLSLPRITRVIMGDDETLEDFESFDQYEKFINDLGFRLKPSEPIDGELQFAGWRMFPNYTTILEYASKHVFKITHTPDSDIVTVLEAYQRLYVYSDVWLRWIQEELAKRDARCVQPFHALLRQFREI